MVESTQLDWIASYIWGIADDVLRSLYVRGKYLSVILPMTVLRRFDAVLEPTKEAVLDMKASLDKASIAEQDPAISRADAVRTPSGKLTTPFVSLSADPAKNSNGSIKHSGLDDHAMSTILRRDGDDASPFPSKHEAAA